MTTYRFNSVLIYSTGVISMNPCNWPQSRLYLCLYCTMYTLWPRSEYL